MPRQSQRWLWPILIGIGIAGFAAILFFQSLGSPRSAAPPVETRSAPPPEAVIPPETATTPAAVPQPIAPAPAPVPGEGSIPKDDPELMYPAPAPAPPGGVVEPKSAAPDVDLAEAMPRNSEVDPVESIPRVAPGAQGGPVEPASAAPPEVGEAPENPPAQPGGTPAETAEQVLNRLEAGNLAFNSPEKMQVNAPEVLQLLLSSALDKEEVAGLVTQPGAVQTASVKIASVMEARLVGSGFRIQPITPEEQPVTPAEPTEWKWEITPLQPGIQRLHLTVNAIVRIEGTERRRAVKTFDREITVSVAGRDIAVFLWLAAAVVAVAGAFLVWRSWRRVARRQALEGRFLAEHPDLFVSYSRKDQERVLPLVKQLADRGYAVWLDQTNIEGASMWAREITEAIQSAKIVLLMASGNSLVSVNVQREIALACDEQKKILPVFLESASIPAEIRYQLAGIQHIDLHKGKPEEALQRVEKALTHAGVEPQQGTAEA